MKHYNIPIFISHFGCPNDCVFCNQKKINGKETDISVKEIQDTVEQYLKTLPKKSEKEVAFFGGTFTGLSMDLQKEYLECLQPYLTRGEIQGIRLSTRPDYINEVILKQLQNYGVTAIELGIQSLDKVVLKKTNRFYKKEQVFESMRAIKESGFLLGVQIMIGLPGSTLEKEVQTTKELISYFPDTVRLYPTLVLEDTELARQYMLREYRALSLEEGIERSRYLLCLLESAGVNIIRVGLQTTEELEQGNSFLAGPFHPAFREAVETEISYYFLQKIFKKEGIQTVFCHEKEMSRVIGLRKKNRLRFGEGFQVKLSKELQKGEIQIGGKIYSREERIRSNIDVEFPMDF